MADLSITAIAVAVCDEAVYRPAALLAEGHEFRQLAQGVAQQAGTAPESLRLLPAGGQTPDVSALALGALGAEHRAEPLFLVRSGPLSDPYGALLARLVFESGWEGEDVGITHLDELGGTVVFDLLRWAIPDGCGGTALICDDPLFAEDHAGAAGRSRVAAAAVRVLRGPGALRVLDCGEGAPAPPADHAEHRLHGTRPGDGWIALRDAVARQHVKNGDRVLIHTRGPLREGWLLIEAVDITGLQLLTADTSGTV
ncbi:MAG TPA: hypothetical protein VFU74_02475 [Actinocrinis sp.]|nr:hypothetical protein [Actinocrinis sp.]